VTQLYCEACGNGSPVVLVHGWGSHGGIWAPVRDALSATHSLRIPDLPGHGRSREARSPGLDRLATLLQECTPDRAVWVGWSLGGLAALAIALRAPARVKALVLIAVTPRFIEGPDWSCAMPAVTLAGFARDLQRDYRATLSRFLSLQLGSGEAERATLRNLRALLFAHGEPSSEGLADGLGILRDADLRPELATISQPVLMIHGARDRIAPAAAAEAMAAGLPKGELVIIPGAGHAPHLSHWPDVAPAMMSFFQKHG